MQLWFRIGFVNFVIMFRSILLCMLVHLLQRSAYILDEISKNKNKITISLGVV